MRRCEVKNAARDPGLSLQVAPQFAFSSFYLLSSIPLSP